MQNFTQGQFIKSYDVLSTLKIIPTERLLLELILSYQLADLDFYMNHSNVAKKLGVTTKYVGKMLSKLSKLGYVIINTERKLKVLNGINSGGSISFIKVDINSIQNDIDSISQKEEIMIQTEVELPPVIEHPELDYDKIIENERIINEKDGFSNPDLANKMADSVSKKNETVKTTPIVTELPKQENIDINNEFDFLNEEEERIDFTQIKQNIEKEEQKEINDSKYLSVQPKNKDISISEYFAKLKLKFPTTEKSFDDLEEMLKGTFNVIKYNDEKLKNEEMKNYFNNQVQIFQIDKFRYLKLF